MIELRLRESEKAYPMMYGRMNHKLPFAVVMTCGRLAATFLHSIFSNNTRPRSIDD